jgi:hypothetical protein
MANNLENILDGIGIDKNSIQYAGSPIEKALQRFIDKLKKNLEDDGANATNKLSQSINPLETEIRGNTIRVKVEMEDYGSKVDQGQKALGFTKEKRNQLQPQIRKWIQAKESLQAIAKTEKEKTSLSYAIATNILKKGTMKRHGYKGNKFYSKEIEQFKIDLAQAIQESYIK